MTPITRKMYKQQPLSWWEKQRNIVTARKLRSDHGDLPASDIPAGETVIILDKGSDAFSIMTLYGISTNILPGDLVFLECGCKIKLGTTDIGSMDLYRIPTDQEVDLGIYPDHNSDVFVGKVYYCESCADLIESVEELGFCYSAPQKVGKGTLREDIREYNSLRDRRDDN